jgi:cell division transport system permease protein
MIDINEVYDTSLKTWLNHHLISLKSSLAFLWSYPISSFLTSLVIAFALSLPIGLLQIINNLEQSAGNINEATKISVYLKQNTTAEQVQEIQKFLLSLQNVKHLEFIDSNTALKDFMQENELGDISQTLPFNPLPNTFIITANDISTQALEDLYQLIADIPEAELVKLDTLWVERLNSILNIGKIVTLSLSFLFLLILVLVVANTIRLYVENRATEINIIRLIGGTNTYIKRPFLYMGSFYGLFGGIISCGILTLAFHFLNQSILQLTLLYDASWHNITLSPVDIGQILMLSIFLGLISAYISVSFYLTQTE